MYIMIKANKKPRKTENSTILRMLKTIVIFNILSNSPKISYSVSLILIIEGYTLYWGSNQEFISKEIISLILVIMIALIIQLLPIVVYGFVGFIYREQLKELEEQYDKYK